MRPIIAISLLALAACGNKNAAPEAAPAEAEGTESHEAKLVEPDTTLAAPVKGEPTAKLSTPTETRTFHAMARCTQMACPDDNKCCNNCSFFAWADDDGITLEGADLPTCEVDGCGKCGLSLEATGAMKDGSFHATEFKRIE